MHERPRYLIGTYTRASASDGIYVTELDRESGRLTEVELVSPAENPSWLVQADDRVVAVNETASADGSGELSVFAAAAGRLSLTQRVSSRGADPCHLAVRGERLAVANYSGGTLALFRWQRGRITATVRVQHHTRGGPHPRQKTGHPHGAYFLAGQLWVPDLGSDRIYRYDPESGALKNTIELPPGSGPRHLSADGSFLVNELNSTVQRLAQEGPSAPVPTIPPDWSEKSSAAEIVRADDLVYVSNRGHDSIATLHVAGGELRLSPCGGRHPRHFVVDASRRWLLVANRDTDNVVSLPLAADGLPGLPVAETHCPAPVHLMAWQR